MGIHDFMITFCSDFIFFSDSLKLNFSEFSGGNFFRGKAILYIAVKENQLVLLLKKIILYLPI